MTAREFVLDTDVSDRVHVARDEDTLVLLSGRREYVLVTLPWTTVGRRRITVSDTAGVARTIRARTADYGADCLRILDPLTLAASASTSFVFEDGYWQVNFNPTA